MGYFSNGTEGDLYEAEHCATCRHGGGETECPIWFVHLLHAHGECGTQSAGEDILNLLIPREGARNGKCLMHLPVVADKD